MGQALAKAAGDAKALVAALSEHADVPAALRRYEKVMRPYVDRCQDLPAGLDGYAPR